MGQQDFQERLARIGTAQDVSQPTYAEPMAAEPQAKVSEGRGEFHPVDLVLGFAIGFVASVVTDLVEFHILGGGDAMAFIQGDNFIVGLCVLFGLFTALDYLLNVHSWTGIVASVAGIFASAVVHGIVLGVNPEYIAMAFSQDYVDLFDAGFVRAGLFGLF